MDAAQRRTLKVLQHLAPEASAPFGVLHRHQTSAVVPPASTPEVAEPMVTTTTTTEASCYPASPAPTSAPDVPEMIDLEDLGNVSHEGVAHESCFRCVRFTECKGVVQEDCVQGFSPASTGGAASDGGPVPGVDVEASLKETLRFSTPGIPKRAKSRLAGPSGNYWWAVEEDANIKVGEVKSVVFWKTPIAIYRDSKGELHAMEDRCPHRMLRLSKGFVEKDNLVCCYHGWALNGKGKVVELGHELPKAFHKHKPGAGEPGDDRRTKEEDLPKIYVRTYPLRVKYGLIFLFPGDPALADKVPMTKIDWLDCENPVPYRILSIPVKAHWSMIIENNCDFFHAFLHRKYRPFVWPHLKSVQRIGHGDPSSPDYQPEAVQVRYDTDMNQSLGAKYLGDTAEPLNDMTLWFEYPIQKSNLENKYKHWFFALPMDEETTMTWYIFLWRSMEAFGVSVPYRIRSPLIYLINKLYLIKVLSQDLYALEEEQQMNDLHMTKPSIELNPLVSAFQQMTIEKWQEYLDSEHARRQDLKLRQWRNTYGAGLSDWRWADI